MIQSDCSINELSEMRGDAKWVIQQQEPQGQRRVKITFASI